MTNEKFLTETLTEVEKAETWDELNDFLNRMDSEYSIVSAADISDLINALSPMFDTLAEWKQFACNVLAIPEQEDYFLYTDNFKFEPLRPSDMEKVKDLCREAAKEFVTWLIEGGAVLAKTE